MDAGSPGERNNQHGEPRRSLEGLDCLGMLPATPANMRPACGTWRRPSVGNRQCAGTAFREKKSPDVGARMGCGLLVVVERQPVQHGRVGIEHQHANVSERSQVQHFHEGLRHALGPVLLPQLFGGDALDMLQVRIRPGGGDQLHADRGAVRDAEGDEEKTARRVDVSQVGQIAAGLLSDVR